MAPARSSPVKRGYSIRRAFSLRQNYVSRNTPIRKAKERIKENGKLTPNQATSRRRQNIRRWNSLICTSQANTVSPQKLFSCLPAKNSSSFPHSPLRSCENNDLPRIPSITVYTESGGHPLDLSFGSNTTAVDICNDVAVEYNYNINNVTNWCLFECLFNGKIERLVEDHETIRSVCHNWDPVRNGYFVFRTDSNKHQPVLQPELAYSASVMDDKDDAADIPEEAQKARVHLLREYLQDTQRFPDLQGPALIHNGDKSGWKKYICCIRGSGVYFCPRRQIKDPKNLKPLCKYDNMEVYTVKHHFHLVKCPTDFCIAIKMHSQRGCGFEDLKFLAFNSKNDLDKWCLTLRLAKHGERLRENYKKALALKDQLQKLQGQS